MLYMSITTLSWKKQNSNLCKTAWFFSMYLVGGKKMETLKLVCLDWVSHEREKYVWEDFNYASWDEIIGRVYLLKAHEAIESGDYDKDDEDDEDERDDYADTLVDEDEKDEEHNYEDVLVDFEQALLLLAKDSVRKEYYGYALADKAHVLCLLGQYDEALLTIDESLVHVNTYDPGRNWMMNNRYAILVLTGAFEDALNQLQARLDQHPEDNDLRFTMATCLLHMERYDEAAAAYEQAMAKDKDWYEDTGLKAARRGQQPDWANL